MPTLTLEGWLKMADDITVRNNLKQDSYSVVYQALVNHFDKLEMNWEVAVVGLHVVYGWMPTIPNVGKFDCWDGDKRNELVSCLKHAQRGDSLDDVALGLLQEFSNNSMVGGSKLLHFLNPKVFPIWDSHVAKAFQRNRGLKRYKFNSVSSWREYYEQVTLWSRDRRVQEKCQSIAEGLSSVRVIEMVMFHKWRPPGRRSKGSSSK